MGDDRRLLFRLGQRDGEGHFPRVVGLSLSFFPLFLFLFLFSPSSHTSLPPPPPSLAGPLRLPPATTTTTTPTPPPPPPPPPTTTTTYQALDIQHQLAARLYADVNLAEYKALLANEREPAGKRANASAVAALAAYRVALQALPFRQVSLDPLVDRLLEGLSAEELRKAGGVAYPVARKVAAASSSDNSGAFEYAGFRPAPAAGGKPGSYAFVPGQKSSLYPQLGNSRLYVLGGGGEGRGGGSSAREVVDKDFRNFSALKVGTPEYEAALAQVARVGWLNSTERTREQAEIPGFWADGAGTPTVAGHYLQIAAALLPENATLLQTAELFARVAVAASDAATVGWVLKYRDLAARPLTALRRGGNGGGPGTNLSEPLPDWEPFLKTPPHPEYPSGHTLTSGSAAEILANWFGRDDVPFTTSTAAKGFGPRNFTSLRASAVEVGDSRLYGEFFFFLLMLLLLLIVDCCFRGKVLLERFFSKGKKKGKQKRERKLTRTNP